MNALQLDTIRKRRNAEIVADCAAIDTHSSDMSLDDVAAKFHISRSTLYRIRSEAGMGEKGFCLICKKLAYYPKDRVTMYQGDNAPVCFACHGTGRYSPAVMHDRRAEEERIEFSRLICPKAPNYNRYCDRCKSENLNPRTRDGWIQVRKQEREKK